MSDAPPGTVGVVGLGLIGASLCGALRQHLPQTRVVGVARRAETARRALDDGLCDDAGDDARLLAGSEVIVLCTPVDAMPAWLPLCLEHAPQALVTDTGSTKSWLAARAAEVAGLRFVGGHPMAGREVSGYGARDDALFDGCTWVLTPRDGAERAAVAPWRAAVVALGAHPLEMDAVEHDAAAAWISHLPFTLSAALVHAAVASDSWPAAAALAASGFRDMVRLAGGDPAMYAAITATNVEALARCLDALDAVLAGAREVLADPDAARAWFAEASQARRAWMEERRRDGRPVG